MSQTPSTEEILHRMRSHVENDAPAALPALVQRSSVRGPGHNPSGSAGGGIATSFNRQANDFSGLRFEIETALEGTRQVGQINPRKPGLHNDAIQFAKKAMRRSLAWYTRPIHYFQGGVIRALQQTLTLLRGHEESLQGVSRELTRQSGVTEQERQEGWQQRAIWNQEFSVLKEKASALESQISALDQEFSQSGTEFQRRLAKVVTDLEARLDRMSTVHAETLDHALTPYSQRLAGMSNEFAWLRSECSRVTDELREVKLQNRLRDRDLRKYFHDIQAGTLPSLGERSSVSTPSMFPSNVKSDTEFDYFLFEERYRGDESQIASRQKEYLRYFEGRDNVVDIGCGRGEFLELLRENGIRAKGVELGTDQYLLCQEKALDVVQEDLFSYLESLPDESLGGLFSAQVIEHFAASDQLRFVSLAYQKTRPGSPVILETINAQCVFAVMRNFFVDPTHIRPVHPETLKFAMESAKFRDIELLFSSPMTERRIPPLKLDRDTSQLAEFNRAIEGVNELLYGFMDYAAIGWR